MAKKKSPKTKVYKNAGGETKFAGDIAIRPASKPKPKKSSPKKK